MIDFIDENDKLDKLLEWKLITNSFYKKILEGSKSLQPFKYKGIYNKGNSIECEVIGYLKTNNYQTLVIKTIKDDIYYINPDYFVNMQNNNFNLYSEIL